MYRGVYLGSQYRHTASQGRTGRKELCATHPSNPLCTAHWSPLAHHQTLAFQQKNESIRGIESFLYFLGFESISIWNSYRSAVF